MARISGIDLPREKRIEVALTYIFHIFAPKEIRCYEPLYRDRVLR